MSCPNCQIAGRRLPSLPLGYVSKSKKDICFKNFGNLRLQHIGSARLPPVAPQLEGL